MITTYANRQRHKLHDDLDAILLMGGLPFIKGSWYFVDPQSGDNDNTGKEVAKAVADIQTAYGLCTSGAGDGIVLISRGTTAANTSSYLIQSLTWSKHGITVVGACAPTRMFQRARIASKEITTGSITTISFTADHTISDSAGGFLTAGFEAGQAITINTNSNTNDKNTTITSVTATTMVIAASVSTEPAVTAGATEIFSYNPQMIVLSGNNNVFYNVSIGNWSDSADALGCLQITGHRNAFINTHLVGAGNATPGAVATAYDLLVDGGQENTFYGCTFGTDSVLKAAANAEIVFDGGAWRTKFYDCEIFTYSSTAGKGAVKSMDATAFSGVQVFKDCQFINWNENGIGNANSAFIGTKPNSGALLMDGCSLVGWAEWDSVDANDMVYVVNSDATATGAGGIATTP